MADRLFDQTPRHVLMLAYYVPPLGLSGVQRVSKLLKYLPEFGWRATLIAPSPAGYFAYDASLLADIERPGVRVRRTSSIDPTRLYRGKETGMPREEKRRFLSEASQYVFVPDNKIGWLPFALREAWRVTRMDPPHVVMASAPPYTGLIAGALAARWAGVPFVADFRDDWLANPRHVYPTPVHRGVHRVLEKWVVDQAARITTINDVIAESLASRAGRPVEIIRQGFDPQDFEREPPGRDETFRLVYTGVFYDAQRPDVMLRGARRFLDRNPDAPLQMVFAGSLLADTPKLIASLDLAAHVEFRGYLPHDETVALQQKADVLWMVIGNREGAESISTGKLFEYIGARKPILALVPAGAAARELANHGAAHVCPPDDVEAVAHAITDLYDRWRAGRLSGPAPEYVARYDRRRIAGQVAGLLDSLTVRVSSSE
jgi:glycosyltransferase involved in cell wall biosynthesis